MSSVRAVPDDDCWQQSYDWRSHRSSMPVDRAIRFGCSDCSGDVDANCCVSLNGAAFAFRPERPRIVSDPPSAQPWWYRRRRVNHPRRCRWVGWSGRIPNGGFPMGTDLCSIHGSQPPRTSPGGWNKEWIYWLALDSNIQLTKSMV